MKITFQRSTSTGHYIPAIDGLRFIAISSVVMYHLQTFLSYKYGAIEVSFFSQIMARGYIGVQLFFVISGFIIGLPFAKQYLLNHPNNSLLSYYLRRVTRLEIPYSVVMTSLLIGSVFVANTLTFREAVKSYLASIFYIHTIIFPDILPKLNAVAWSLEVEVQFYLIAPLIVHLFKIKNNVQRRLLWVALIFFFTLINEFKFYSLPFVSLVDYFHYFIIGLLVVDLYVCQELVVPKTKFDPLFGLILVIVLWSWDQDGFYTNHQQFIKRLLEISAMAGLYYYILLHQIFNFLTWRAFTIIGGMCYSIYLLHYPILSIVGNRLVQISFTDIFLLNYCIYIGLLLVSVIVISMIFYLAIEKPYMQKHILLPK